MKTRDVTTLVSVADLGIRRAWTERFLANAADLPISFMLDGKQVRGIPAAWNPTMVTRRLDANLSETRFEGRDPQTGLQIRVEAKFYQNYPVVEWVVWLSNDGVEATPILSEIQALDATFSGDSPVIYHCNGDFYSAEGYAPVETPLARGQ